MEMVRKFVDAESLMSAISLPETFKNRTLEVLVFPTEESTEKGKNCQFSAIIDSLVGAIPRTDMSLSELREERLRKYKVVG